VAGGQAGEELRRLKDALKREVVARHPRDRLAYMAGKDAYVVGLEARALADAQRPGAT
jgi:GrpB-like predicted nucleotidyltransferase (UPF0157 family)